MSDAEIAKMMTELGVSARAAARELARSSASARALVLEYAATAVLAHQAEIISANQQDMLAARSKGLSAAMLDRLSLDAGRITDIADGLKAVANLPDPVGKIRDSWSRPNGLRIDRVSVPLGVIGIIYESRPNVTADAAALCIKSGNAVILRGGSESYHSSQAIYACLQAALDRAELGRGAIQMVPTTDRAAVGYMLSSMHAYIDVVVPRGGKRLIQRVQEEARVPVIGHLEGICHVYLHASADVDMATDITVNAKMRRTGICGAAETLLVDSAAAARILPQVSQALIDNGCALRADDTARTFISECESAVEEDWSTEYLDAIISVRVVADLDDAVRHIETYGSGHTECIVAEDADAAARFCNAVDSAILMHNASTQFADGGEFGMGGEIGIATGRIHARGPVGAEQLTSYKYVVAGSGQTRPG